VATSVNAVPDLVIPGQTGLLVPPRRPALLARALGYLLDSPAAAARLGAAGREHVADRYGPATLAGALMAAYDPAGRERYEKYSLGPAGHKSGRVSLA
jgi:glycosyltransferase involved in cell wall biosynthesis